MDYTPLKMHPCYKEYLWGGTRLKTEFGKSDAPGMTAESWELADNTDGVSTVECGSLAGATLSELGQLDHDGFWGRECSEDTFPVLIKLIDAAQDLSIQVHPSDSSAIAENGEHGKAELWYIVDASPKSAIYYGFSEQIDSEDFLRRAHNGTICEALNRVSVSKGDVFYILPGTIHAVGAGIIIAEIQQNSNTTFRIFDYLRRDSSGKLRPLNLERASSVADFAPVIPSDCRANNSMVFPEFTFSEMFSCKYFRSYCIDVRKRVELCCDGNSFHHILCVEGKGNICSGDAVFPVSRGDSYFIPAFSSDYSINGTCKVLLSKI